MFRQWGSKPQRGQRERRDEWAALMAALYSRRVYGQSVRLSDLLTDAELADHVAIAVSVSAL